MTVEQFKEDILFRPKKLHDNLYAIAKLLENFAPEADVAIELNFNGHEVHIYTTIGEWIEPTMELFSECVCGAKTFDVEALLGERTHMKIIF